MKKLLISIALILYVPAIACATGRGSHAPVSHAQGIRGGGHPGIAGPAVVLRHAPVVPRRAVMPLVGYPVSGGETVIVDASPPLIIERSGDGCESLQQAKRPAAGPLVIEWREGRYERIH